MLLQRPQKANTQAKEDGSQERIYSCKKRKAFARIQHPLIIKTLSKPGTEGNYINLMKNIDKTSGNIVLHGKRLNTFPIETGNNERHPPSPFLFNQVLKVLAIAIKQEKEIKGI